MVTDVTIKNGYKQTELGVIPADWEVTPLTGLVVIQHGYGFQSQYFKPFGKYRLTTPGHFHETGGFRDVGEKQKFYEGPLPEGYLLSEGDLIVAMTEQADGLLGSAAIVPISNTYLHNQRLGKVKVLSPDLSIRFLYRVFNSKNYRAKVRETAAGTKVKHTSPSKLLEIPVPLPSTKAEQEAISTLLSDTDALIECLEKLIAKKKDIKQGAMQQLLTGKTRLPGFSGEWEVRKLEEIAEVDSDNLSNNTHPDYSFKYISLEDVDFGVLRRYSEINFRNAPSRSRRKVRKNDILISTVRPNLKSHLHITDDIPDLVCSTGFSVLRCYQTITDPGYVYFHLFAEEVGRQIESLLIGSNYPAINGSDVRALQIPFPPLPEQRVIADILRDMDAEIAALEQKRDKISALKQGMMQELLTGKTRLV